MDTDEQYDNRFLAILLEQLKESNIKLGNIDETIENILPDMLSESVESLLQNLKSSAPNMLKNRREELSGFEARLRKVWGKPLDLLEMFLVITLEAGEEFNRQFRPMASKEGDFVFDVLTRLHARSCQVGFEILTLLKSGYADGAHARWRTLHEIAVTAYFIAKYGNDVAERYLLHEIIESYKGMIQYQKHCKMLGYEPFTEEEVARFNADREEMVKRFGRSFRHSYGWASNALGKENPKFSDIEQDVNLEHLHPYYKMASHNVHSNPKGIAFKLGLFPTTKNLLMAGPSNAGLADPGHSTAISLNQITATLLTTRTNFDRLFIIQTMLKLADEVGDAFLEAHSYLESLESD